VLAAAAAPVVVAASLLVALAARPMWTELDSTAETADSPAGDAERVVLHRRADPAADAVTQRDHGSEAAWNDSLDERLLSAERQIGALASAWHRGDVGYYSFQQQAHELAEDLAADSL
jgi:hypothetical protein